MTYTLYAYYQNNYFTSITVPLALIKSNVKVTVRKWYFSTFFTYSLLQCAIH